MRTCISLFFVVVATTVALAQSDSRPWFIGLEGGIYRWSAKSYTRVGLATATSLAVHDETPYVIGIDSQIWSYAGGSWAPILPGVKGRRIAVDFDGTLYLVGTDSGVYAVRHGTLSRIGLGLAQDVAVCRGEVYVIGTDGLVWRSGQGGDWRPYNALARGKRVAVSAEGTVFIIGTDTGVYQVTPTAFTRLGLASGVDIAVGGDGQPYIVGTDHGVWRFEGGQWKRYGTGLAGAVVFPR